MVQTEVDHVEANLRRIQKIPSQESIDCYLGKVDCHRPKHLLYSQPKVQSHQYNIELNILPIVELCRSPKQPPWIQKEDEKR